MPESEIFENALRDAGDLAGVFEYDGETGYFYLYKTKADEGQKVAGAIYVLTGSPDFQGKDLTVRWNASERIVGLFIRGRLWAAFDCKDGAKYGGNYRAGTQPSIPAAIVDAFQLMS